MRYVLVCGAIFFATPAVSHTTRTPTSGIFCNSTKEAEHIARYVALNTRHGDVRARMMLKIHQGRAGRYSKGEPYASGTDAVDVLRLIRLLASQRRMHIDEAWCEWGFGIVQGFSQEILDARGTVFKVRVPSESPITWKYYVGGSSTIVDDVFAMTEDKLRLVSRR